MKRVLITGITGQDGFYLAEYLLGLRYEVHGLARQTGLEHIRGNLLQDVPPELYQRCRLHAVSLDKEEIPLVGCAAKIEREVGWRLVTTFEEMVRQMVDADVARLMPKI